MRRLFATASLALLVGLSSPGTSAASPGVTTLVSRDNSGSQIGGVSPAISNDGRFVAFVSGGEGSGGAPPGLYVHDRDSLTTELVSVDSSGLPANDSAFLPTLSSDGRFVAFKSFATNLVPNDDNDDWDVFVHDRLTGGTERVGPHTLAFISGEPLGRPPSMSSDGRFVAFESYATDLASGDTNNDADVFVYDRAIDATELISAGVTGSPADGGSYAPTMSADGRFVAFESYANDLGPSDPNPGLDIFVRDRESGEIEIISVTGSGLPANESSRNASINGNGRFVAYESWASNLVEGDGNYSMDVFVYDRLMRVTERVSEASTGAEGNAPSRLPDTDADGRFIAFQSLSDNLVQGDDSPGWAILVKGRTTNLIELISVNSHGTQADDFSRWPSISGEGRLVAFESYASNLVTDDTNGTWDVFVHDRSLPFLQPTPSPVLTPTPSPLPSLPPCPDVDPAPDCQLEGTIFLGVEDCPFIQTTGGVTIGPLSGDLAGFTKGDGVRITGRWEPASATRCSHPLGPFFFRVIQISALPVNLPPTGGDPAAYPGSPLPAVLAVTALGAASLLLAGRLGWRRRRR